MPILVNILILRLVVIVMQTFSRVVNKFHNGTVKGILHDKFLNATNPKEIGSLGLPDCLNILILDYGGATIVLGGSMQANMVNLLQVRNILMVQAITRKVITQLLSRTVPILTRLIFSRIMLLLFSSTRRVKLTSLKSSRMIGEKEFAHREWDTMFYIFCLLR